MLVRRYHPLSREFDTELSSLVHHLNHLFDGPVAPHTILSSKASMPIELSKTANAYQLKAIIPGLNPQQHPEQLDIQADENSLTILVNWESQASKAEPETDEKPAVLVSEFQYGQAHRRIEFDEPIETEGIVASYKKGILTLEIPKLKPSKPSVRKVAVQDSD